MVGSTENTEFNVLFIIWISIMIAYVINYIIKATLTKEKKHDKINFGTILFIIIVITLFSIGIAFQYHYYDNKMLKLH